MNIYQIIGTIWLINTIVIAVIFTDSDDYPKSLSFIAKFVYKYHFEFAVCYIITIAISVLLLRIEVE